eukprot:CAMPEP_0119472504 /NCGR_PEP_ID=MMETSP1344-20130328/4538_1 /TAXON_ID=236787 /ORGANISM="Florenciella parvula, Strain CCMP2471" /LENGTH=760 /DNA_ID=CAMNT_0007505467 /DNA_START=160 /DNA_END=2438 /DNA_ORIENTATION=-
MASATPSWLRTLSRTSGTVARRGAATRRATLQRRISAAAHWSLPTSSPGATAPPSRVRFSTTVTSEKRVTAESPASAESAGDACLAAARNSTANASPLEDIRARECAMLMLREAETRTFRLNDSFVDGYDPVLSGRAPPFGFNGLGELVYLRTYARVIPGEDGQPRREMWHETVRRVVEGCFSMQWRHSEGVAGLGFDHERAGEEAEQMFDDIFHMRFLPPGRGLWAMGTALTEERGLFAALNNCAFVSTAELGANPRGLADPFCFLMDASMLGVGVGFDCRGAGSARVVVPRPAESGGEGERVFVIEDSREGWVQSMRVLLEAYLHPLNARTHDEQGLALAVEPVFDYSLVRPAGAPIRGFGGKSQGPEPLQELHMALREALQHAAVSSSTAVSEVKQEGALLQPRTIVDIMNMIGRCVVAGNVRRTAEIAFGHLASSKEGAEDETPEFLQLKDYERFPDRAPYGWASNNSVYASVGHADYAQPSLAENIALNGEPGFAWPDNMVRYGRLRMAGQHDAPEATLVAADGFCNGSVAGETAAADEVGGNPCLEQTLESYELCCLVECFPNQHLLAAGEDETEARAAFMRTLRSALLYAKSVSLGPLHWAPSNRVLLKNRRIGVSMSGIQQFVANAGGDGNGLGLEVLRQWCEEGYAELRATDNELAERFTVRPSIKLTSVKPSGTVSLVSGATPGLHWPEAAHYMRRVRMASDDELLPPLVEAGYHCEPAVGDEKRTTVVTVPVTVLSEQEEAAAAAGAAG